MAILVAYDGSDPAQEAVEHAVRKHADEEIILLRIVELADGFTGAGYNLLKEQFEADEEAPEISEELRLLLDEEDVEFRIETAVGDPARELVEFAEDNAVDHIIVGSHGRQGVSRVLLGSVAEKVVRRAPMPVTVVR
ncbi:universal stress protein [Natronosalvus rutilus]|uniref:Universal stress protein n=1 Tax=Natronosalvus rutilus TaxID=2953753 RepID=A0A9E7NDC0_9EURY|nr:universal stress protein [Natronosalvus rutilus]UTF55236.1 universal stress protein [Natronosalvus rutilus]